MRRGKTLKPVFLTTQNGSELILLSFQNYDSTARKAVVPSNIFEEENVCKDAQTATLPTVTMPDQTTTTTKLQVTTSASERVQAGSIALTLIVSFSILTFH